MRVNAYIYTSIWCQHLLCTCQEIANVYIYIYTFSCVLRFLAKKKLLPYIFRALQSDVIYTIRPEHVRHIGLTSRQFVYDIINASSGFRDITTCIETAVN
jgi:hypothetical protein